MSYTYGPQSPGCSGGALSKAHAVVSAGTNSYCYDLNGNMTRRSLGGTTYDLSYDAENRLAAVSGGASAGFAYDGDGRRVKGVVNGTTTIYIGDYFEWTGSSSTVKKYYYADGARIALRSGSALSFLLGDHLGSTTVSTDGSGVQTGKLLYKAWGEERFSSGATATSFRYTGQRLEGNLGLYFYGARWYDAFLGRFIQPDTIIPEPYNSMDWDRYSYARNNSVLYSDPTGHKPCNDFGCPGELYDPIKLAIGILHDPESTRYWDGLTKEEQQVLKNASWDRASFNEFMGGGNASPADFWHDPLTYIEIVVVGSGLAKAGLDLLSTVAVPVSQEVARLINNAAITGRNTPLTLKEKLAMEAAKADPLLGKILPITMNDPRWPAADGWVKMQQNINGVIVHYVYNIITGQSADFKFK